MLKAIKDLFLASALYLAIIITISIGVLSLIEMPKQGLEIGTSDKVLHFIAYFVLMLIWLYAFSEKKHFYKRIKYLIGGCLLYGIILEALQGGVTSYRTASYLDILANSVGIILAVLAFHLFEKKIRIN